MTNVQIVSTSQNRANQKRAVHYSSSTVFFAIFNPDKEIDTEVSLLNHFILKRNINDVMAKVEIYDLKGQLKKSLNLKMDEKRTYSVKLSDYFDEAFIGSIYIFFKSSENLAVPFCAVMTAVKTNKSVSGVHTYGRILEQIELGTNIDIKETIETGWTVRDQKNIKSFAVLHGGKFELDLKIKLEISNHKNEKKISESKVHLDPFGSLVLVAQDLIDDLINHLDGKKGHAKVYIEGIKGIFPRMLCGNYLSNTNNQTVLSSKEIQFTHTNFDFSNIKQPDALGSYGYYNQPSIPNGYGIIYPVETSKTIYVDEKIYSSNTIHYINTSEKSQIPIHTKNENLPSRFVAAAIGNWKDALLESECSTGTFTKDWIKYPCHWHWGLLKPSFEKGKSIISILVNKFDDDKDIDRTISLRLFDNNGLIIEQDVNLNNSKEINTENIISNKKTEGPVWYVLSGDKLEDLYILSTFYPKNKSGFVEHAF